MSSIIELDTKKLLEQRNAGYTLRQLADLYHVSLSTINRRIKEAECANEFIKETDTPKVVVDSGAVGVNNTVSINNKVPKNGPVTTYLPEYKKEITPTTDAITYTYKGFEFKVSVNLNGANSAQIKSNTIIDVLGAAYEPKIITHNDADAVITIGEALVGIGHYLKKTLLK